MKKPVKIIFIVLVSIMGFLVLAYAALAVYVKYINPPPLYPDYDCIPSVDEGCWVIEDEGKKKVVERPEIQALIEKYGKNNIHVKAVDIDLVQDIEFIQQIHPSFQEETGCVIVVHTGSTNEGFVYQEDKDLNVIYMLLLSEFIEQTKNVDYETMSTFYLSLH